MDNKQATFKKLHFIITIKLKTYCLYVYIKDKLTLNNHFNLNKMYEIIQSINTIIIIITHKMEVLLFSALLWELYLINYEKNNILSNKLCSEFIKTYFRYVDDIFILFRCTHIHVEIMVDCLKNLINIFNL